MGVTMARVSLITNNNAFIGSSTIKRTKAKTCWLKTNNNTCYTNSTPLPPPNIVLYPISCLSEYNI